VDKSPGGVSIERPGAEASPETLRGSIEGEQIGEHNKLTSEILNLKILM
jgi:hypothetical protein